MRNIPGGARAASCAAWRGVTWRGLGAKTKPIASTFAASAAVTASTVVIPHILIHMRLSLAILGPARAGSRKNPGEMRGRIRSAHQGSTDQRRPIAEIAHGARLLGRPDAASGYRRQAFREAS